MLCGRELSKEPRRPPIYTLACETVIGASRPLGPVAEVELPQRRLQLICRHGLGEAWDLAKPRFRFDRIIV